MFKESMSAPVTVISTTVEGFEITFTRDDGPITDADVRALGDVVIAVRELFVRIRDEATDARWRRPAGKHVPFEGEGRTVCGWDAETWPCATARARAVGRSL